MKQYLNLTNPCNQKKGFCQNCSSHFMAIRPLVKNAIVHKKFFRDLGRDREKVDAVIKMVLDCTQLEFHELHKFEKNVDGNLIFRAKQDGTHYVYCVNKKDKETILFLRAINNFNEYKRLLSDEQQIKRMVSQLGIH